MEFSHEIYHNIHSLLYHRAGRQQSLGSPESQLSWTWVSVWTFSQKMCVSVIITLSTKVHIVKALIFPVVTPSCES